MYLVSIVVGVRHALTNPVLLAALIEYAVILLLLKKKETKENN